MKGYKVYYDTSKLMFRVEPEPSECHSDLVPIDGTDSWVDTYEHAVRNAETLNRRLEEKKDIVRICRGCFTPFVLCQSEIEWYKNKGWYLPKYCDKCRVERRKSKEGAE